MQLVRFDFPGLLSLLTHVIYRKKESAKLAQEQSTHLYLCVMISDLTQRYGPVIRPATVVGVLDAAFDVLVPEFGIEKRVHVDQMPIDVSCLLVETLSEAKLGLSRTTFMRNTAILCRSIGRTAMSLRGWLRIVTTNI